MKRQFREAAAVLIGGERAREFWLGRHGKREYRSRMATVRIGTCSFADEALARNWYPRGLPPRDRLRYYARHFDTVEVDSTYYRLPDDGMSAGWAERTPPGFLFHVKAFALMTRHPVRAEQLPPDLRAVAELDERGRLSPARGAARRDLPSLPARDRSAPECGQAGRRPLPACRPISSASGPPSTTWTGRGSGWRASSRWSSSATRAGSSRRTASRHSPSYGSGE